MKFHYLQEAVKNFSLAETYAGDGAIVSAAICATRAVEALELEWTRWAPLRAGPLRLLSLADVVKAEIVGRKADSIPRRKKGRAA